MKPSDFRTGLTAVRLRKILHYDPATGLWTWAKKRGPYRAGSKAGTTVACGYVRIGIAKRYYFSHRLAWLYMTGGWPASQIDHQDTDKSNNRWRNLRAATAHQNQGNRRLNKNNTSGFKGVWWHAKSERWVATIAFYKRRIFLGSFYTLHEAHAAYKRAAAQYFHEFGRAA